MISWEWEWNDLLQFLQLIMYEWIYMTYEYRSIYKMIRELVQFLSVCKVRWDNRRLWWNDRSTGHPFHHFKLFLKEIRLTSCWEVGVECTLLLIQCKAIGFAEIVVVSVARPAYRININDNPRCGGPAMSATSLRLRTHRHTTHTAGSQPDNKKM